MHISPFYFYFCLPASEISNALSWCPSFYIDYQPPALKLDEIIIPLISDDALFRYTPPPTPPRAVCEQQKRWGITGSKGGGDECVTFADGARLVIRTYSPFLGVVIITSRERQTKRLLKRITRCQRRFVHTERSGRGRGKTIWMLMARDHIKILKKEYIYIQTIYYIWKGAVETNRYILYSTAPGAQRRIDRDPRCVCVCNGRIWWWKVTSSIVRSRKCLAECFVPHPRAQQQNGRRPAHQRRDGRDTRFPHDVCICIYMYIYTELHIKKNLKKKGMTINEDRIMRDVIYIYIRSLQHVCVCGGPAAYILYFGGGVAHARRSFRRYVYIIYIRVYIYIV